MNIKIIKIPKRITSTLFLILGMGICANSLVLNGVAKAYCDNGAKLDDICVAQTFDGIQGSRLNETQYRNLAQKCTTGDAAGLDFGYAGRNQGACANAAAICVLKAIDPNSCTAGDMATIAKECNIKNSNGNLDNCDRLKEVNNKTINKTKEDAEKIASNAANCPAGNSGGDATSRQKAREACQEAVTKGCITVDTSDFSKNYNNNGYDTYKACVDKNTRDSIKNPADCTQAGGTFVNGKCKLDSEMTDEDRKQICDARGGSWHQANARGSNDASYCSDTQETCNKIGGTFAKADPNNSDPKAPGICTPLSGNGNQPVAARSTGNCGRARTNLIKCDQSVCTTDGSQAVGCIGSVLKIVLTILSVLVGIAAVGGIIYGAILYASAQDNSGQVSKAKEIIRNVVIGLLLYVFMVAILNWLVPGGVFTG